MQILEKQWNNWWASKLFRYVCYETARGAQLQVFLAVVELMVVVARNMYLWTLTLGMSLRATLIMKSKIFRCYCRLPIHEYIEELHAILINRIIFFPSSVCAITERNKKKEEHLL